MSAFWFLRHYSFLMFLFFRQRGNGERGRREQRPVEPGHRDTSNRLVPCAGAAKAVMGSFGAWLTRNTPSLDSRKGLGLRLKVDETSGLAEVVEIEKNTAAWTSPLNIGDTISHIDGVPVRGRSQRQMHADLLGPEGSSVELRVEVRSFDSVPLCGKQRHSTRLIRLVRGVVGGSELDDDEDMTLQVRVDETQHSGSSMAFGILCMPTEHILYVFSLRLQGFRWQVQKRYSDFLAVDARLRAKYGNRQVDALLAKSRLPGKAFWDKTSKDLINKRKRRLEEYILALATHPLISRDHVYMSFLQYPDDLYSPAPDRDSLHGDSTWSAARDLSPRASLDEAAEARLESTASASTTGNGRSIAPATARARASGGLAASGGAVRSSWGDEARAAAVAERLTEHTAAERLLHCLLGPGGEQEAEVCREYVRVNFEVVAKSRGFLNLPRHVVAEVVSDERLSAREEAVFDAVVDWAKAQVLMDRSIGAMEQLPGALGGGLSPRVLPFLVPMLRHVRFPLMAPESLVLRVLNGKEAATCAELRELATEAVMWQAVPVHARGKMKLVKLQRHQCMPRRLSVSHASHQTRLAPSAAIRGNNSPAPPLAASGQVPPFASPGTGVGGLGLDVTDAVGYKGRADYAAVRGVAGGDHDVTELSHVHSNGGATGQEVALGGTAGEDHARNARGGGGEGERGHAVTEVSQACGAGVGGEGGDGAGRGEGEARMLGHGGGNQQLLTARERSLLLTPQVRASGEGAWCGPWGFPSVAWTVTNGYPPLSGELPRVLPGVTGPVALKDRRLGRSLCSDRRIAEICSPQAHCLSRAVE